MPAKCPYNSHSSAHDARRYTEALARPALQTRQRISTVFQTQAAGGGEGGQDGEVGGRPKLLRVLSIFVCCNTGPWGVVLRPQRTHDHGLLTVSHRQCTTRDKRRRALESMARLTHN